MGRFRRIHHLPVFHQGEKPLCVACSLFFLSNWFEMQDNCKRSESLLKGLGMTRNGIKPLKALKAFLAHRLIPSFYSLRFLDHDAIAKALYISPVFAGFKERGHRTAVIILDRVNDEWQCLKWDSPHSHDICYVDSKTRFDFAYVFSDEEWVKDLLCHSSLVQAIKRWFTTSVI